jgi:hypothetical protein
VCSLSRGRGQGVDFSGGVCTLDYKESEHPLYPIQGI